MTDAEIIRLAEADAADAITIARESGDESVGFITGNSYMPPLRDFGSAETVWQAQYDVNPDDNDMWILYVETFENAVERAT